jgi:hypothetical protein
MVLAGPTQGWKEQKPNKRRRIGTISGAMNPLDLKFVPQPAAQTLDFCNFFCAFYVQLQSILSDKTCN